MNNRCDDHGDYRVFQLMSELETGEAVSQRELAGRLGVAVGLVNSYLRHFVAKGFVRVKAFPRNRYAYLLTPKGFSEKSRLAYGHLNYFTGLYTTTRRDYLELFQRLNAQGVSGVVFCGVDEVSEIAYLSLQEAGLELTAIAADPPGCELFFGRRVVELEKLADGTAPIVLSTLKRKLEYLVKLESLGVPRERILAVG